MTISYDPVKNIKPRVIAFDWETTGLNLHGTCRGFALALCDEDENTEYIEFPVNPRTREVDYSKLDFKYPITEHESISRILTILADPVIAKVGHNVKFDLLCCEKAGIAVLGEVHDTQFMARACNTLEESYSLKDLAKKYVNIDNDDEKRLKKFVIQCRREAKKAKFSIADSVSEDYWLASFYSKEKGLVKKYCVTDTIRTIKLFQFYEQGLPALDVAESYHKELELMYVIRAMERRGVEIDENKLKEVIGRCVNNYLNCLVAIKGLVGELNINSPKQLGKLFGKLGINITETTDSGLVSTALPTLKKYSPQHPVIPLIIESKSWDTSLDYFKQYNSIKDTNNVIHTSYNQATTKTWRLSSSNPNLQNVSNEDTSTGSVHLNGRSVFRPRKGYIWALFDYSQLELRLFASRSQEPTFLKVYKEDRDAHNETRVCIPSLAVLPEELGRKIAKIINFLIIYGGGYKALAQQANIPEQEARLYLEEYHNKYAGIRPYANKMDYLARTQGFIVNAYGRKLNVDSSMAYKAVNYDIQSSAADLMKNAMLSTHNFLKQIRVDAHLVLTIHDELFYEINNKDFSINLIKQLKLLIEDNGGAFSIPTPATVAFTTTYWDEKVKVNI